MKEQWMPVSGFDGLYEISSYGRVKSLPRNNKKIETLLTTQVSKRGGYLVVTMKNRKTKMCLKIHRLVAYAFISNPKNLREVNHRDGNKRNNKVSNLEWCTRIENVRHSIDTGLQRRPELTGREKPVIAFDKYGREVGRFLSIRLAGRVLNVCGQNICAVLSGKARTAKGYTFKKAI